VTSIVLCGCGYASSFYLHLHLNLPSTFSYSQAQYCICIYDVFMRTEIFLQYHEKGNARAYWAIEVQELFGNELEYVPVHVPCLLLLHLGLRINAVVVALIAASCGSPCDDTCTAQ
jgi:hypothetical protein